MDDKTGIDNEISKNWVKAGQYIMDGMNKWENVDSAGDSFPSSHIYAHTMAYIMNAPHVKRTDEKMWKPDDFYDAERVIELELKRVFIEVISAFSYTTTDRMDFSDALRACAAGKKITNENWDGTNQYVIMISGYPDGVPANEALSRATGIPEGRTVTIDPYLMLRNAQGHFVNWTPSMGDLFSTSWKVIE